MRYRVSKDAERDLDEIFVYWAKGVSVEVADRLIDGITDRFWLLGDYPDSGKPVDKIAPGVKCFPAGKYLIYYRKEARRTDILHIFHAAREQKQSFRKAAPTRRKSV